MVGLRQARDRLEAFARAVSEAKRVGVFGDARLLKQLGGEGAVTRFAGHLYTARRGVKREGFALFARVCIGAAVLVAHVAARRVEQACVLAAGPACSFMNESVHL